MDSYFCSEHNTEYFKKGHMKGYAHPIGDTGKWCNEGNPTKRAATDVGQGTPSEIVPEEKPRTKEPDYKSPINRSIMLSYAKDLVVAGKIEIKDILACADKFVKYIGGEEPKG